MTPLMLGGLIFAVALLLLATGMPIAFALGSTALIFMLWSDGFNSVMYMADTVFSGLDDFTLASIPMFIIMGAAVASSRAGSDLYEALNRWLYKVPGSLVISNRLLRRARRLARWVSPKCAAVDTRRTWPQAPSRPAAPWVS
jgi:C4-dicarboxylate transporter, DctM subunit